MKLVTNLIVTELLNIEVWTQNEERYVCLVKEKTKMFFSKIIWSQFTSYCDEKLKNNERGIEQFGKKKTVKVSDVVTIITKDIPGKNIVLDTYEWTNLMKVQEKVRNILNNKEEHYMLSDNTFIHARKPTEHNVNVWAVFEKTDIKGGDKCYMSDKVLKRLLRYRTLIDECLNNFVEDKFHLDYNTFVGVIKIYDHWYISLISQFDNGIAKKVFNLTVNEWKDLKEHLPNILELLQPDLLYTWCYKLEGFILEVGKIAFTNEEQCVSNANDNVPSYDTYDGIDAPTHDLHITGIPFPEDPINHIIPRFKWKHMLRNNTVQTDFTWYMCRESCRIKGLHAETACEKADKLIVQEQGGKPLVINLETYFVNDLKYNNKGPWIVYIFLLEKYITSHMHPNDYWNTTVTKHLLNAKRNIDIENFMYVCNVLGILLTLDQAKFIVKTADFHFIENELLERYRLTIKESIEFDWS